MDKKTFTPEIQTERLTLKQRKLTFETAAILSNLIKQNKDFLSQWMPWALAENTPEECYAFSLLSVEKWNDLSTADYMIYDKAGTLMGCISMKDVNYDADSGEIGYWLGEEFNGNGYMTEAVYALENEFFNRGIERVFIKVDALNIPSLKVAKRCGYKEEGTLRHDDWNVAHTQRRDTKIFSKLKEEWQKQKN